MMVMIFMIRMVYRIISYNIIPQYVIPYYIILYNIISCHIISLSFSPSLSLSLSLSPPHSLSISPPTLSFSLSLSLSISLSLSLSLFFFLSLCLSLLEPSREVAEYLKAANINKVIVGHQPRGDCPLIIDLGTGIQVRKLRSDDISYCSNNNNISQLLHYF